MRTFGPGTVPFTKEHELAILTELDWDGTTAAYPLIKQWFQDKMAEVLDEVEAAQRPPRWMAQALEDAVWARDYKPEPERLAA